MNFIERLDQLLREKNITKKELSVGANIPYATIQSWYQKGYSDIRATTLLSLSDFFNCSVDYLLGNDSMPSPELNEWLFIFNQLSPENQKILSDAAKALRQGQG